MNPYLRKELIADMLFWVKKAKEQIKTIFGDFLDTERFNILLGHEESKNKDDILKLCEIEYIAPGDAAKTNLSGNSVNYHISNTVYEHIPLETIRDILTEGGRIITEEGLFINIIDYADHFSCVDKNISVINFLQYNDKEWKKYSGNRYAYTNRARHDEFIELFKSAGHDFIEIAENKSKMAKEILENGKIKLDARFEVKGMEILSITGGTFITKVNKDKRRHISNKTGEKVPVEAD